MRKAVDMHAGETPKYWGERVAGVITTFNTEHKVVALTLDACGGKKDGYDKSLIDYLIEKKIPATLFINARWIDKFPLEFEALATNPLFEIENHGMKHLPCSVSGKVAYGIQGTKSGQEVVEEIELNADKIEALTGRRPLFYRCGTAYYDEIAINISQQLGCNVVGFSILGDAGATYSANQVETAVLQAKPGDIIICHMNHPESGTAAGLKMAIPSLLQRGFSFARFAEVVTF